jgi:hypothetical protein
VSEPTPRFEFPPVGTPLCGYPWLAAVPKDKQDLHVSKQGGHECGRETNHEGLHACFYCGAVRIVIKTEFNNGEGNGVRMLSPITLDSVQAESMRDHLSKKELSFFNPELPLSLRLAVLGEQFGEVCTELAHERGDRLTLVKELIELGSLALVWAEVMDAT